MGESAYSAERVAEITRFLECASDAGASAAITPFQAAGWLEPWFRILAPASGTEPMLIVVRDTATGQIAMLLPLVRRRVHGVAVLEFPDLSVSDYAFPLLGPAAPRDAREAQAAWQAALGCVPKIDVVRLHRLPALVDARANPITLLPVKDAGTARNIVKLPGSWEAYLASRSRSFRKELRKHKRLLEEMGAGECRIEMLTDAAEARQALSTLDWFQSNRMEALGTRCILHREPFSSFYREVVRQGLGSGFALLSVVKAGGQAVAVGFSLLHRSTCTTVRLAHIGGGWNRCGPGIILATEIIKWLIENGLDTFDFGAGEHDYKTRLGCELQPLYTYEKALSARGYLALAAWRGTNLVRQSRIGKCS
jgi:CelD/BcsL family acetyltransferase involved in cellulose biosynthesis